MIALSAMYCTMTVLLLKDEDRLGVGTEVSQNGGTQRMSKLGENRLNSCYFDMCRISSLLGNCVYEISAPPKEFPSINGNYLIS